MTPREELLEDIDHIVEAYGQSRQETRRTLNKYAIGKWVPVSERLPEFGRSNIWTGTFKTHSGRVMTTQCHKDLFGTGYVTHWLELDLPEDKS
jgi:hypothetical protein